MLSTPSISKKGTKKVRELAKPMHTENLLLHTTKPILQKSYLPILEKASNAETQTKNRVNCFR